MGATHLIQRAIGIIAMFLAILFSWEETGPVFLASLFLFAICLTDTFWTRIPNVFNLTLILAALGYHLHFSGAAGFLHVVPGFLAGTALLLVPYLLGGMGAGDVKAMGALGALTGAPAILQIFIYVSLIGGVIGVLCYLLGGRTLEKIGAGRQALRLFILTRDFRLLRPAPTRMKFPYAAAIAFGYFAYVQFGAMI